VMGGSQSLPTIALPLPLCLGVEHIAQAAEGRVLEVVVAVQPRAQQLKAGRVQPVQALAAAPRFLHEAGFPQHPQLLRDGGAGHVEARREVGDAHLALVGELRDECPPSGIAESGEHQVGGRPGTGWGDCGGVTRHGPHWVSSYLPVKVAWCGHRLRPRTQRTPGGRTPGSVAALTLKCAQSAHTAKRCQQQRSLCTRATRRTCRRIALDGDALGQVDFQE
jgi:hypothetical protein